MNAKSICRKFKIIENKAIEILRKRNNNLNWWYSHTVVKDDGLEITFTNGLHTKDLFIEYGEIE